MNPAARRIVIQNLREHTQGAGSSSDMLDAVDELEQALPPGSSAPQSIAGGPCRVCGGVIGDHEADAAVAGSSDCGRSRAAHGHCWNDPPARRLWAYPV
jgi:hypothetical protein